jgi:ATP-dependent helicase/nuclease subunit B
VANSHSNFDAIVEPGTTVLTVNNRLARTIAAAHAQAMQDDGHAAWETPDVLPYSAFVMREWELLHGRDVDDRSDVLPRLLSTAQCKVLWQRAVQKSAADGLLSLSGAASSAAAARELLLRHEAKLSATACHDHIDAQAFRLWHADYKALLSTGNWIDIAGAGAALASYVRDGSSLCVSARIQMRGFELLSTQQQTLLDAYRSVGVDLKHDAPTQARSDVVRVEFASPQTELQAMARWVRDLLDDGEAGPIGIVLPDLETRLDAVEECFEDRLHPSSQVRMQPELAARAFNISLGRDLVRMPVVASALASLQFLLSWADAKSVGTVALSDYFDGAAAERAQRLALDLRLREAGVRSIRMTHLARVARAEHAPSLSQRIVDLIALAPHPRSRHSLAAHVQNFTQTLDVLGWPSGRSLGSVEYQAVEALRAQLEALAAMDSVSERCSTAAALLMLQGLVADAVFQPRTAPAPVQILGVLEAAGMTFSKLWIGAMDDSQWPPVETPNALLPVAFQRQHAMPGASPEIALIRARGIINRLLSAAPQVIVSHARADGDTPLRTSPEIALTSEIDATLLAISSLPLPDAAIAAAAPPLEALIDWRARALGPGWKARGGSRVLTDQAACPFRAFAHNRLAAKGVARARAPLDPSARGNLAHRFMQELFVEITSSEKLLAMNADERAESCRQAASRAVSALLRRHPGEIPAALLDAERSRMAVLGLRWLEVELTREPFQVEALEQRRKVRIGGLNLSIQLDRVDLVHGRRVLIDYKTGKASRNGWFGTRPDEPQLPLYALALDSDGHSAASVAALCFAKLRRAQEGFEGVGEDESWMLGLKALGPGAGAAGAHKDFNDMSQLKSSWTQVLTTLAEQFAGGDARVDPKPQACRYCQVRALCRVDAIGREDAHAIEDDAS